MFRALLAHPQEALHKRHLVYCVRVMSVGSTGIGVELYFLATFRPRNDPGTHFTGLCNSNRAYLNVVVDNKMFIYR
jgi:hypothetical protein